MELTINDKTYNFVFGVKFVRELDKQMPIEADGIKFGMGLASKVVPELKTFNINTLARILYIANRTESPKVKQDEIDDFIDSHEDIEQLFDDVTKELSESNAGKLVLKKMDERLANQ